MVKTPQEYAESAKATYQKLKGVRDQFKDRAVKYSKLTLPYILPDDSSDTSSETLMQGYSSEGAVGVNNLSNKYINRMFPHYSYFKLTVPDDVVEASSYTKADVLRGAVAVEKKAMKHLQKINARTSLLEAIKHLIITGNYLMHKAEDEDQEIIGYPLDRYVVQRDQRGRLLTCIATDTTYLRALPPDVQGTIISELNLRDEEVDTKEVDLYTRIELVDGNYLITKSAESVDLGNYKTVKKEKLRWEALVWHRYRRDPYGRGLVEDIYNAIYTHDVGTEIFLKAAAIAADIKIIADRASGIDVDAVNSSESGTWHYGDPNGVKPLQVNKTTDLQIMDTILAKTERLIGQVFMRMGSAIRNAERVTAEENRLMAIELDQMHGGVFSSLANSLQLKLALWTLEDVGTAVDGEEIEVSIITGIDALGRQAEAEQAVYLVQDLAQWQNVPQDVRDWVKFDQWVAFVAAGRNIDISAVIRSRTEYEQHIQQRQQAEAGQAPQQAPLGQSPATSINNY